MNAREGTKKLSLLGYRLYVKWRGFEFELLRVADGEPQLPFVPTEAELDALVASSPRKLACLFVRLLERGYAASFSWEGSKSRQLRILSAMFLALTLDFNLLLPLDFVGPT
jgi:hypothetical protein